MFSICATIYGDYPQLAAKLLDSIAVNAHVADIRLGLNSVSSATSSFVHSWAMSQMRAQPVFIFEPADNANVGKYPLMRQMFRYGDIASKIMWFDDDSYVDPSAGVDWWHSAHAVSKSNIQVGAVHSIMQRGRQHEVIKQQLWYQGRVLNSRHRYRFVTGGWWIADSAFLLKWDYPFPALHHNGGDSILGELLRQQYITPGQFHNGMQCHCEACSKKGISLDRPVVHINVGGRKGRRGIGVRDENYVWSDGNPTPDLNHQNFNVKVYRYEV